MGQPQRRSRECSCYKHAVDAILLRVCKHSYQPSKIQFMHRQLLWVCGGLCVTDSGGAIKTTFGSPCTALRCSADRNGNDGLFVTGGDSASQAHTAILASMFP